MSNQLLLNSAAFKIEFILFSLERSFPDGLKFSRWPEKPLEPSLSQCSKPMQDRFVTGRTNISFVEIENMQKLELTAHQIERIFTKHSPIFT